MGVYARILRMPGVATIVFATAVGRLPIGISGLAILLYVQEVSGSFAAAGLCAGALALGSAAGAPLQGRLIDWRGEGALLPLSFAHAGGLLLVWGLGAADAGPRVLAVRRVRSRSRDPAGVVGAALALAAAARRPARADPSAYALDSVLIELIFVTGPLLTTVTVATVGPQYALAVSAACVLGGTFMLLAGLRGRERPAAPEAGSRRFGLGALAAPGLRTLVLASLPVGFAFGTIEVVLPAFSAEEGHRELAGVLLAVWASASGVGGLVYGARQPRSPLTAVHLRLACALPIATAVLLARHVAAHAWRCSW